MSATCKGICTRYKANRPVGGRRYLSGQRRCRVCHIFLKWDGLWCPCCGYRLRGRPRGTKFRKYMNEQLEKQAMTA